MAAYEIIVQAISAENQQFLNVFASITDTLAMLSALDADGSKNLDIDEFSYGIWQMTTSAEREDDAPVLE